MTSTNANTGLSRRITKEIECLGKSMPPQITIRPHKHNLRYFDVTIEGPLNSPYEGGIFKLEMFLNNKYPTKPPKIRFLTKLYHLNVDKLGRNCLDVLADKWTPGLNMKTICLSIQLLLQKPNPDDPLDNAIAELWKTDIKTAHKIAREWTKRFANP